MSETKEALEQKWPPEQVWLPTGVVMLAAVSPELENVEGAHWVRKDVADAAVEQAVAKTWKKAIAVVKDQLRTKNGGFLLRDAGVIDALEAAKEK